MVKKEEIEIDPCTGFPSTHKAKLSIPTIIWTKQSGGTSSELSVETPGNYPCSSSSRKLEAECKRSGNKANNNSHFIGLGLTLLSSLSFSFNVLVIKLLSHCHPFSLGIWTFLLVSIFSFFLLLYEVKFNGNESILEEVLPKSEGKWGWWTTSPVVIHIFARVFFGTTALILFFYAVKYLTVADALVIDASSPIFVYILAYLILREEIGLIPIFTAFLALTGVAFIARPPLLTGGAESEYDLNTLVGVILAFLAMLCIASSVICLKSMEQVHFALINTTFGVYGTVQCLVMSIVSGVITVPSEISDVLLVLCSATLFFIGQVLITVAVQYEDAGPVGLVRTTEVFFIYIWQYSFLGVVPDIYSYIGAALVVSGVALTIGRKWIGVSTNQIQTALCNLFVYK